jgi:hypothetical protein
MPGSAVIVGPQTLRYGAQPVQASSRAAPAFTIPITHTSRSWILPDRGKVAMAGLIVTESAIFTIFVYYGATAIPRPVSTVSRRNRLPRRSPTSRAIGCPQLLLTNCDQTVERLAACAKMSPISATLKKSSCLPTVIREAAACNSSRGPLAALRSTKVIGDKV